MPPPEAVRKAGPAEAAGVGRPDPLPAEDGTQKPYATAGQAGPQPRAHGGELMAALAELGKQPQNARRVLLSLSDPSTEPIPAATTKAAAGAWPGSAK